jgi:anti-sigma factor RsiW
VAAFVRWQISGGHLGVESSEKHTVKPWFNGKVDVAPPVEDLKTHDFTLRGGRLDYTLDGHKAAVLVYQRRKHMINVFIWRADTEAEQAEQAMTLQGYHLIHWARDGMTFWVISDLKMKELQEFARLVQRGGSLNH